MAITSRHRDTMVLLHGLPPMVLPIFIFIAVRIFFVKIFENFNPDE